MYLTFFFGLFHFCWSANTFQLYVHALEFIITQGILLTGNQPSQIREVNIPQDISATIQEKSPRSFFVLQIANGACLFTSSRVLLTDASKCFSLNHCCSICFNNYWQLERSFVWVLLTDLWDECVQASASFRFPPWLEWLWIWQLATPKVCRRRSCSVQFGTFLLLISALLSNQSWLMIMILSKIMKIFSLEIPRLAWVTLLSIGVRPHKNYSDESEQEW